ncbi:ATP-binding cassette domain-containing protein [Cardiobacteriales bacterium ML27]|uniref:ATP-binding cassette domain-containing protein n=2 Tax=Ostreibacterium oceani TaxID=2654998 RepID=A0A6N7EZZ7_9GAMM|nr:ABC transporter ATP-binding protein [Ostreibacterium oceani]MPV86717.1 ATP-binding cassette domain-containing protein [Ostreibacterium oceani]
MHEFLTVENITFSYDDKPVLHDINFQLAKGKVATLLGPSGCGKTTLLRLIAGFYPPDTGRIIVNQQLLSSDKQVIPPEKRHLGMIFQDYALFPHLSVFDNIAFGIKKQLTSQQIRIRVNELLEMVGLPHYEKRFAHELSGGEQQRVAIARAIAPKPALLLMDEPFASLDANLRERLVRDLGKLLKSLDISVILVTHDQREAFAVSDHVGLMREGKIIHWDLPYNIYHEPKTPFVANFVGQGIMVSARISAPERLDCAFGSIHSDRTFIEPIGTELCLLLRPDDIVEDKHSPLAGRVVSKYFHGASTLYEINFNDINLIANFSSHANYAVGETVHFRIQADHLVTFNCGMATCVC